MKHKALKPLSFMFAIWMFIVTVPFAAYADQTNLQENELEVAVPNVSDETELNQSEVDMIDASSISDREIMVLTNNNDEIYPLEQIIHRDCYIKELGTCDYFTVSYYYTHGVNITSQAYKSEMGNSSVQIPVSFLTNYTVDNNNKNVYNVYEDSIIVTVDKWIDDNIVETVSKKIWVLSTPYGIFVSDIDLILTKRAYLTYLSSKSLIDQSVSDDLDRIFHCGTISYSDNTVYNALECSVKSTYGRISITSNDARDNSRLVDATLATNDETVIHENYADVSYSISLSSSGNMISVYGYVTWYDSKGNAFPAQYVSVDIVDDDVAFDDVLTTVTTSSTGYFFKTIENNASLENGYDIYLKVYPGNENTRVYDCGNFFTAAANEAEFIFAPYYFTTAVTTDITESVIGLYGYAYEDSIIAKSFSIGNALYYAREYEKYVNGGQTLNSNPVKAHYPLILEGINMSSFTLPIFDCGTMFLTQNKHDSWPVIFHEYAHAIEDKLEIFVGYQHIFSKHFFMHEGNMNLTDFYEGNKQKALDIAWNEGWATYYSTCVQYKYDLSAFPGTSKTTFAGFNVTSGKWFGEDNELAIATALNRTVLYRELLTDQELWAMVKENQPKGFHDVNEMIESVLSEKFLEQSLQIAQINKYCKILEEQNFAASNLSISFSAYSPTFSWREPVASTENINDIPFCYKYELVIVSKDFSYIFSKPQLLTTSYTPTTEEWKTISIYCADGFYWTINTSESKTPCVGSYSSEIETSNAKFDYLSHNYLDLYTEERIYIEQFQQYDYYLSFSSSGNHIIQTLGSINTVFELYSEEGVLLVSSTESDNAGYSNNAFISYNFDSSKNYILRVKLAVNMLMGNTKITIVSSQGYNGYNSIPGPFGCNTQSVILLDKKVVLLRYQFETANIVEFELSSVTSSDTYLYVIDPASSNLVVEYNGTNTAEENLQDDDSGVAYQAQINKLVTPGKEYLIIISKYDPSGTGNCTITTNIIN